jgi:hypothetical protein
LSQIKRKKAMKAILVILVGAATIWGCAGPLSSPAGAQNQPVFQTVPAPATTAGGNASGTITTTGTFQKVFSAVAVGSPPRKGCLIENNGAAAMDVSEGKTAATATAATSYVLAAGASWTCQQGGVALQGEVDITGTSTQVFYAVQF